MTIKLNKEQSDQLLELLVNKVLPEAEALLFAIANGVEDNSHKQKVVIAAQAHMSVMREQLAKVTDHQ